MTEGRKGVPKLPGDIFDAIQRIRDDNTSGAVPLAREAAKVLSSLAATSDAGDPLALAGRILLACRGLIGAQPAMASIFNLANDTMLSIEGLNDIEGIRSAVGDTCRVHLEDLDRSVERLCEQTLKVIPNGSTVMTYSYSSTVASALIFTWRKGKSFDVICSEGRPMLEGVALAEDLGREGIDVRLTADATLFSLIPQCQMILVGADSLSPEGLVNKVGTSGLAMAAREHGVDLFTLCGKEKFLPEGRLHHLYWSKDPDEILTGPPPNVKVINHYFDLTPLRYLKGVITEEGVQKAEDILTSFKVCSGLM